MQIYVCITIIYRLYYEQDSEGQLQDDFRKILSTHFE